MDKFILAAGLFCGGAIGFGLGARPDLLLGIQRSFRPRRKASGAGFSHGDPHAHASHGHEGHNHPAYQDREGQEAQDMIDFLYPLAVAFFAGFVLSTLVPDALSHSRASLGFFAAGAAVMGVLSKKVFKRDPCCEGGHDQRGFGAVSLLAMSVCSLNDGLLLGLLSPAWWSSLNAGMFIHKITSSFAIAQVLKQTRFRGAALYAFGAFSVGISPSAFLAVRLQAVDSMPYAELALAFSAGILAWVALGSLLPHARAIMRRRPPTAIGFAFALAVSVSLGFWHTAMHHRAEADAGPPSAKGP